MADVVRVVATEGFEIGLGKKATVGEHDEERLDTVTLALDVAVAPWIEARSGRDAKDAIIEDVQDVRAREAPAGVAGARVFNPTKDIAAVAQGFLRELLVSE